MRVRPTATLQHLAAGLALARVAQHQYQRGNAKYRRYPLPSPTDMLDPQALQADMRSPWRVFYRHDVLDTYFSALRLPSGLRKIPRAELTDSRQPTTLKTSLQAIAEYLYHSVPMMSPAPARWPSDISCLLARAQINTHLLRQRYSRGDAESIRVRLDYCDLAGFDFAAPLREEPFVLSGSSFIGSNLTGADLSDGALQGTAFIEADLHGVRFDRANLAFANFTRAHISDTSWKNTGATLNPILCDWHGDRVDFGDWMPYYLNTNTFSPDIRRKRIEQAAAFTRTAHANHDPALAPIRMITI